MRVPALGLDGGNVMETLATVSGSISENVLVIHDSEPGTLIIWLFMMCIGLNVKPFSLIDIVTDLSVA